MWSSRARVFLASGASGSLLGSSPTWSSTTSCNYDDCASGRAFPKRQRLNVPGLGAMGRVFSCEGPHDWLQRLAQWHDVSKWVSNWKTSLTPYPPVLLLLGGPDRQSVLPWRWLAPCAQAASAHGVCRRPPPSRLPGRRGLFATGLPAVDAAHRG